MITPAVLISACGTLIFSTSNRLARIVDRVRKLSTLITELHDQKEIDFREERHAELRRQLSSYAIRGQMIQQTLTAFYFALGIFVATTIAIGIIAFAPRFGWLPSVLGIVGTVILFYGCVLLVAEARLALRSVNEEMQFTLRMSERQRSHP